MSSGDRLRFVLVTGFGLGLAPVAPGTFGTLAGVVPAVLIGLALHGRELAIGLWVLAGVLLAFGCAQTDFSRRTFHKEDPGPFVLDEVVGYLVTVAVYATLCGDVSPTAHAVAFLAFRAFDVVKPPPCRRLEELHGAAGIMLDDVAAGLYAGAVVVFANLLGLL